MVFKCLSVIPLGFLVCDPVLWLSALIPGLSVTSNYYEQLLQAIIIIDSLDYCT
jgi:hypothetical protein